MRYSARTATSLLVSTALASILMAQTALAQEAAAAAANAANDAQLLGDVVVTATRQADTVNRVPLSISAVTQKALDQQGIKSVADLQRSVPALTVSGVTAGVATFTVRGIAGTGATSATTGVYLDDIPLQKRSTNGVQQNNGTPAPPLFDLERVEVLRGPQGTLFGGSSEGGTLRFITPQPSLTRYSALGRAEIATTHYGSESWELGAAVGGPIVRDKLGFRVSVDKRDNGGWIDLVDPYNIKTVVFPDSNSSDSLSWRAALAFQPTEQFRATLSFYTARQNVDEAGTSYLLPLNRSQLTTPAYCYNLPASTAVSTSNPLTPVACPANAVPGQTVNNVYMRPSQTYTGPWNFEPFQNFASNPQKSFLRSDFSAPSLTLEYNFPKMSVKAITSYTQDEERSFSYETPQVTQAQGFTNRQGVFFEPGAVAFQNGSANTTQGANLFRPFPFWSGEVSSKKKGWGLFQELRFASAGDPKPLSWVAGVYYSNVRGSAYYWNAQQTDRQAQLLFGIPSSAQRFTQRVPLATGQTCANLNLPAGTPSTTSGGACFVGLFALPGMLVSNRYQTQKDVEIAAFGELNYWITDKLKATGGVRLSRTSFEYHQIVFGQLSGQTTPTTDSGITNGQVSESPVTPKVGLQYQITDNDMIYLTAAKGFRAGGVNVPLAPAICGSGLALIGLTVDDAPKTYGSDTVWSYEGGGKLRMFGNRLQVNTSAYRIAWNNVQLAVSIPNCGPTFIQNAGSIRSQGFDLQAQGRVFRGLTANLALGYDKAEYTMTATGPSPKNGTPPTAVVQKGDKVPVPPWTVSAGAQYDFTVGKYAGFIRADYQFSSKYLGGFGPGVNGYSPDTRNLPSTQQVNARAGVVYSNWELNLFVNNLFDSKDPQGFGGGRSGCTPNTDAACGTFSSYNPFQSITTFRPRTIGAQLNYRY